jgi:hypothetical protein
MLAAVVTLLGSVGAGAQTVFVRNGSPGDVVEVFVNDTRVGAGAVETNGEARVPADIQPVVKRDQMDASIYIDSCPKATRVFILSVGRQPPAPEPGCRRNQLPGLYWVRTVNTLVVNVASQTPSLMLIVGRYTPPAPGTEGQPTAWTPAPTGIILSGGGMYGGYSNYAANHCGDVSACEDHDKGFGYHVSAAYWFTTFLAAEGTYLRPKKATVEGSGTGYRFDGELDAQFGTLAALLGGQAGPMRLYGRAGMAFNQATTTVNETIDDKTVTIDDVPVVVEGGTATYETITEGWGWLFGGGMEIWFNRYVGVYGELNIPFV